MLFDELGANTDREEETRRRRQDQENNSCIGGLRKPARGLRQIPGYTQVGRQIAIVMGQFVDDYWNDLMDVFGTIGVQYVQWDCRQPH